MKKESFTHSHSSINMYEQCPRQFESRYVIKEKKEPQSEQQKWGDLVHTAMEDRVRGTLATPLPEGMENFERVLEVVRVAKGAGLTVLAEQKIAVSRDGTPVDFWSKYAWVRGKVDLSILGRTLGDLSDYKTGKWKSDKEQMRLTAWMAFDYWPALQWIKTRYHWLNGGDQNQETHTRETIAPVGVDIKRRIIRIEDALASGHFEPKPNGLCKAHCGVLSCTFNGRS